MRQHVPVRMPRRAFIKWEFDSANNQFPSGLQSMQVVSNAAAHAHFFCRSRSIYDRASSMSAGLVIFILRSEPNTTCTSCPIRSTNPASSEAFTPSACARANASFNNFVENACGVWASTMRSRGIVAVISATSSGKLARFTSFTVSIAGMPRIAALQLRASSITRAICSRVTNGRTASWTKTISVSLETSSKARATESCRESPPRTTRTFCLNFSAPIRSSSRATSSPRVATIMSVTNSQDAMRRKLKITIGTPSNSKNCLGVSAPMRVPSPAAGRMAAMRFIVLRDAAREMRGQQTSECTSTTAPNVLQLISGDIDARDAGGYGAEEIGGDGADAAGDGVRWMHVFAVGTVDGDDIADFGVGDVGDIDHGYIHGDNADDGRELATHEHAAAAVTKRAVNAVAIAGGENRDHGRTLRSEFCSVAHTGTGGNAAQANDARAQAHHRLQRQAAFRFWALLRRVVAGMIAVKNDAGAHHISPTLRARGDGGAIGHVHDASVDTELAQSVERVVEALFLLESLLAFRRRRERFGGSEVRHYAAESQMFAFCELAREAFHIADGDAEAVHAGVDFQVEGSRFAWRALRCGAIQRL